MTPIRQLPTSKRVRDIRLALAIRHDFGLDDLAELRALMLEARALEDTAASKLGRVVANNPTAARRALEEAV